MYFKIGIGIIAAVAIGVGIVKRKEIGKKVASAVSAVGNVFAAKSKEATTV